MEQNPQQLARLRRELRVSFFFAALVIGALGLGLPLLVGSGRTDWIALGAIFSLGQVGVAAGFLVLPRSGLAWAAVAIELIASLSLVAAAGPSLVTLVLLAFPFFTVFRIFKWQSLEAEARALAGST